MIGSIVKWFHIESQIRESRFDSCVLPFLIDSLSIKIIILKCEESFFEWASLSDGFLSVLEFWFYYLKRAFQVLFNGHNCSVVFVLSHEIRYTKNSH